MLMGERQTKNSLEEKLKKWAQPPGDTEKEKCERSVRMVKQAIDADAKLATKDIEVFPKGSFHNRTNIPSDSDVDVGALAKNYYFNTYPTGKDAADFGFVNSTYTYEDFKAEVAVAVQNKFGKENVTVGKKAIQVHASTARVDADVVPHFVHRAYKADGSYDEGVALKTDDGQIIYNWPDQDYNNGVAKNEVTKKRYKAFVRILKNIRGEMKDAGYSSADKAASYMIACLGYNIPDFYFDEVTYEKMVDDCLAYLKSQTRDLKNVAAWTEVNEKKLLFGSHQGWKFDDVADFIADAVTFFEGLKK